MNSVFFLILRRMRAPLIVLIVFYAVGVLVLTFVPGRNEDGTAAPPLSFFHAFYFISYTATSIGFGEIPRAFSDAQRLWVTICIYMTVIGWTYSVATVLTLLQDKAFLQALAAARFARRVRHLRAPFYLICGCGETGSLICRSLDFLGYDFTILEKDALRVEELDMGFQHGVHPRRGAGMYFDTHHAAACTLSWRRTRGGRRLEQTSLLPAGRHLRRSGSGSLGRRDESARHPRSAQGTDGPPAHQCRSTHARQRELGNGVAWRRP